MESSIAIRRISFGALVLLTWSGLVAALVAVLARDGAMGPVELAMASLFGITTIWLVIGFWNALIGFVLLRTSRESANVGPRRRAHAAAASRTAVAMPVFNEDPEEVFRHLATMAESLRRTGAAEQFDLFLLSDSGDAATIAREEQLVAAWRAAPKANGLPPLHYRRRADNAGYKAGNIAEFCQRWGDRYDYMIVLDADSVMSGGAMVDLVRAMDADAGLGIVQTVAIGLPASSPFARIFQFGMRHGMRVYAEGSRWWQHDAGPYWGHNAILRMRPFRDHCRLPDIPGRSPLSGAILSHDQVEAALMRAAGYHVRVVTLADGSWEKTPPTLVDFIKRDLRWCQGNLQYLHLLGMRGIRGMGRLQLVLAILMYVSAPCWLGFLALGLGTLAAETQRLGDSGMGLRAAATAPSGFAIGLFALVITMSLAPKLLGLADTLFDRRARRASGGGKRIVIDGALDLILSVLLSPVIAVVETMFMAGLVCGRRMRWDAQARESRHLPLAESFRRLWLPTAVGLGGTGLIVLAAPAVLPWAAPILLGLSLAAPLASITADPDLGRWLKRHGICATAEELALSSAGLDDEDKNPDQIPLRSPHWEVSSVCDGSAAFLGVDEEARHAPAAPSAPVTRAKRAA